MIRPRLGLTDSINQGIRFPKSCQPTQRRKGNLTSPIRKNRRWRDGSERGELLLITVSIVVPSVPYCKLYLIQADGFRRCDVEGAENNHMQQFQIHSQQPTTPIRGGRVSSPKLRKSLEEAESFLGLDANTKRYDLLTLVKRVGKKRGLHLPYDRTSRLLHELHTGHRLERRTQPYRLPVLVPHRP